MSKKKRVKGKEVKLPSGMDKGGEKKKKKSPNEITGGGLEINRQKKVTLVEESCQRVLWSPRPRLKAKKERRGSRLPWATGEEEDVKLFRKKKRSGGGGGKNERFTMNFKKKVV